MTDSVPPLVTDIDGTLTDDDLILDSRVGSVLRDWDAPVVVATGKALPFPLALCQFLGLQPNVIAENGGISYVEGADSLIILGDSEQPQAVAEQYREAGHELGWEGVDFPNRYRETEVIVAREEPLDPLREIADTHDVDVVDTQYAYHVKSASVNKGRALEAVAREMETDPADFVAIGDSTNDVETFQRCGRSFAVANADEEAKSAADHVTEGSFGDGFLEALEIIRDAYEE